MPANYGSRAFLLGLAAMMLAIAVLCALGRSRRIRWAPLAALTAMLCVATFIAACGGGGSGNGGGGGSPGTQTGTCAITVAGTSGSGTATHTAKLTLVVQ